MTGEDYNSVENRRKFIGGSDIASVMGMSRWKSTLELWAEKTGQIDPEDLSEKEYVQLGSELEDFVAKKFERETGKKVRRAPQTYENVAMPYIRCQVDRLIEKSDELLECKTCSAWKAKEWDGEEIPQEYILQVMWQLGITGRKVGWIAVLIGGQSFKYKRVDFDEKLWEAMKENAVIFWQMVESRTPPMAVGMDNKEVLLKLNPVHSDEMAEANEMNEHIKYLQEVKMHIANLEEEKDKLEATLKEKISGRLGLLTNEYKVTWKSQSRRSVDTVALKADMIYDRYAKTTETRVLRIANAKK